MCLKEEKEHCFASLTWCCNTELAQHGQLGSVGVLQTHPSSRELFWRPGLAPPVTLPWERAPGLQESLGHVWILTFLGLPCVCFPKLPARQSRISTSSLLGEEASCQSKAQLRNQIHQQCFSRNFTWKERFNRSYQNHSVSITFQNHGFE